MALSVELLEIMQKYGVGRRKLHDPFLEDKEPERLGVFHVSRPHVQQPPVSLPCSVPSCRHTASSLQEQTRHYELSHRYNCSVCHLSLPTDHLLGLHVQEMHDSFYAVLATKRPSYCCYIEECGEKFWSAEERFNHGVEQHKLPKDFRLEQKINKKSNKKNNKNNTRKRKDTNEQNNLTEEPMSEDPCIPSANLNAAESSIKPPKNFSFGHNKHRTFHIKRFTSVDNTEQHIDMDAVVNDLKNSLPE